MPNRIKEILKDKYITLLILFTVLYVVYFTVASFLRFDNFYTGRFDLGNNVQAVWNTNQGRIFDDTRGSRLMGHADFILILISPFYLIWPNPKLLLFLQTLTLSFGAVFVYLIAKEILKNKGISLVFSVLYLLNPAVQFTNLYDFHAVTFATTFLLGAFYFLLKKQYLYMVVFLILAGLSKENVWLITSFFGLYLLIFKKEKFLGLSIFTISLTLFYYLIWVAIPNVSSLGKHFALSYYSDFTSSPLNYLKDLAGDSQILYLKQLFGPLGFLSILSPFILFSIPELFLLLLSKNTQLHSIYYHYSSTITPFIFISAIYSFNFLFKKFPRLNAKILTLYAGLFTLYSVFSFGPLPISKSQSVDMFTKPLKNREIINSAISKIPEEYSVAATNDLGSHLSERQKIYTIPDTNNADVIVFLIRKDAPTFSRNEELRVLSEIKNNDNYIEVFRDGEFIFFQKKNLPPI